MNKTDELLKLVEEIKKREQHNMEVNAELNALKKQMTDKYGVTDIKGLEKEIESQQEILKTYEKKIENLVSTIKAELEV